MKASTIFSAGFAGLLLSATLAPTFVQAAKVSPAQPDSNGNVGAAARIDAPAATAIAMPPPGTATVCLQLHRNAATIFNFNLTINPDVYPYTITSGTITGSLCQAATWQVTSGGTLGNTLLFSATRPATSALCATGLTVSGTASAPSSYVGTYTFPGGPPATANIMFLGFNRTTCP